jgi:hypothetical protein
MFSIFESFFVLNVETKLHRMGVAVARGLATPVVGLLETAIRPNPQQRHTAAKFYQPG